MSFEDFWKEYPRRVAKFSARTAFDKAMKKNGATENEIIEGAKKYAAWLKQPGWKPEPKHPATWLNGGCWLDELEESKPQNKTYDSVGAFLARWENNRT